MTKKSDLFKNNAKINLSKIWQIRSFHDEISDILLLSHSSVYSDTKKKSVFLGVRLGRQFGSRARIGIRRHFSIVHTVWIDNVDYMVYIASWGLL